jgi:hypothetical protein
VCDVVAGSARRSAGSLGCAPAPGAAALVLVAWQGGGRQAAERGGADLPCGVRRLRYLWRTHAHSRARARAHARTFTHTHTHTQARAHTHTPNTHAHTKHARKRTHTHACTHAHPHTHTNIHKFTRALARAGAHKYTRCSTRTRSHARTRAAGNGVGLGTCADDSDDLAGELAMFETQRGFARQMQGDTAEVR